MLGGQPLWERTRELIGTAEGQEEIRWQHRADADDVTGRVASLVEQESDRRLAIWLRVRVGGHRMTEVAAEYGYRDGSGVHQVVKRLEERARTDRALARRLRELTDAVSSVKEARRNCCGGVGAIGPVGHRLNHAAGFKTIGARRPCRILLHLRVFNKTIPRPTCSRAKAKPFQLACRTP